MCAMRPKGQPLGPTAAVLTCASRLAALLFCICFWTITLAAGEGCAPHYEPKKLEMEPIGTIKNVPTTTPDEPSDSGVTSPNSGTPNPNATSICTSSEFDNLPDILAQCEVPMPRASEVPSIKDKLEVKVATAAPNTPPGGRVDVQITLRNKSNDAIPLYFTGDPNPRFDVEAVDGKGRRADMPSGKWPGYPKGFKPETREVRAAKVTLEKNGTAKIKVVWDAIKTKWAPDQARSWEGRGYPRVPSGPLGPGKYSLRAILPLIGDVDVPKAPITVGGG